MHDVLVNIKWGNILNIYFFSDLHYTDFKQHIIIYDKTSLRVAITI